MLRHHTPACLSPQTHKHTNNKSIKPALLYSQYGEVGEAEEPCEGATLAWDEPHQQVRHKGRDNAVHHVAAKGVVDKHEAHHSAEQIASCERLAWMCVGGHEAVDRGRVCEE